MKNCKGQASNRPTFEQVAHAVQRIISYSGADENMVTAAFQPCEEQKREILDLYTDCESMPPTVEGKTLRQMGTQLGKKRKTTPR